jgi:hypothetical protein
VHAPQGELGHSSFLNWAGRLIQFAETLGSEMLVFHPEERAEGTRQDEQSAALQNMKYLRPYGVMIAVETLWDKDRPDA